MKRFLTKILFVFVLPLIVLLSLQEFALRSAPNTYAYKNQWLSKHASELKILSLGSSHGYFGIQSAKFSKLAFNAACVSQSLLFDKFILEKFISQMDSLEYVILPVSYFSLRGKGLEHSVERWRVKNYTIYYDCPYFKYQPEFALECYKFEPKATIQALLGNTNHIGCDSLGWGTGYSIESRAENWKETGQSAAKRHTSMNCAEEDIDKNTSYINSMIATCKSKGIKVILVTTPTYHTYYEQLNKEQLEQMVNYCEEIAEKSPDVIYLNWLEHPDFDEHDFYDADHLDEYGAAKLTQLLDHEIMCF